MTHFVGIKDANFLYLSNLNSHGKLGLKKLPYLLRHFYNEKNKPNNI
jgi:hypothetical protein